MHIMTLELQKMPPPVQMIYALHQKLSRIVKSKLSDFQIVPSDAINHPVLVRDSARPETRQSMLQGFGLTDPVVMAADRVFDQFIYTPDHFFVRLQPVLVILPSQRRENEVHA